MTEQDLLMRIAQLESRNKELTNRVTGQEEAIKRYESIISSQRGANTALTRENTRLKNDLFELTDNIKGLREYQNFLEILTGIYEANSHYDNVQQNLQISLTELAARFMARSAILIKKDDIDGKFKIITTALQYVNSNEEKRDPGMQTMYELFDFKKDFGDLFPELEQSNPISPIVIEIDNCGIKSELCKFNKIDKMVISPLITKQGFQYVVALIDPEKKVDKSILSCIAIAYTESVNRILQERLVEQLSITDNLTGLYDHTYLTRVTAKLEEQRATRIGYVMIDLYRLKHVNDNFGHETGDNYIKKISQIIKKHFCEDLVFRLGGDEYSVITQDKDLHYIAEKLDMINKEIELTTFQDREGNVYEARIDAGIDYTFEPVVFKELMHNADLRMNESKNQYYETHGINRRK